MAFEIHLPQKRIDESQGLWPDCLPTDDLDNATARNPERAAFVGWNSVEQREIRLSYAELTDRVERIATGLLELGIGKGDVVAFQLPNWWQFTALFYACVQIGAIANPLMPIFRQRELRYMLGFSEAKVVVVPQKFRGFDHAEMLSEIKPDLPCLEHIVIVDGDGPDSFKRLFLDRPAPTAVERQQRAARGPSPNDLIQLIYTSGTSGEPKAVMHTSNTVLAPAVAFINEIPLTPDDVVFMGSPFAHQTGFLYGMLMPVRLGSTAVVLDIWSAEDAVSMIEREGATFSMASTPFLSDMIDLPDGLRKTVAKTVRTWVCAGAPIPRILVQRAKAEMNLDVLSAWGMTENGCMTLARKTDPPARVFQTDGRAVNGTEARVVDDSKRPVAADTEGHLQARGITHFVGYLKKPHLNSIDKDGWFDTGDLARQDKDSYIRIVGRTKDVIIRGGENIPVAEVENMIYRHPDIAECAIVAMPDDRLGERACVFILTKDGRDMTLPELTGFLGDNGMAKQYWPERVEVVAEMPRTPSGKIQKFKLRELATKLRL